jgi:hypothetical protein
VFAGIADEAPVPNYVVPESEIGHNEPTAVEPEVEPAVAPAAQPLETAIVEEPATPVVSTTGYEPFQDTEADNLRQAIARTTESMEASGIAAPESIGPAEVQNEPEAEIEIVEEVEVQAPQPEEVPGGDVAGELRALADSPSSQPASEPSVPAWPWDATSRQGEPATDGVTDAESEVPLDLEEAPRPPFEEAFTEPPSADLDTDVDTLLPIDAPGQPVTPMGVTSAEEPAPSEPSVHDDESDFIMLDDVLPSAVDDASEPSQPDAPGDAPLSTYTCNDCVYVDTCPNKDQNHPEDCGSFQWK